MRTPISLLAFVIGLGPVTALATPHVHEIIAEQQAAQQVVVLIVEGMT
ncbi:MAG: hypothetical protein AB7L71_01785 [Vicinamibacterales bacterium]|jgi:hypothetical protein